MLVALESFHIFIPICMLNGCVGTALLRVSHNIHHQPTIYIICMFLGRSIPLFMVNIVGVCIYYSVTYPSRRQGRKDSKIEFDYNFNEIFIDAWAFELALPCGHLLIIVTNFWERLWLFGNVMWEGGIRSQLSQPKPLQETNTLTPPPILPPKSPKPSQANSSCHTSYAMWQIHPPTIQQVA